MRASRAGATTAAALIAAAAVAVAIGRLWNTIGGGRISLVGWLAMAGGVILAAALGMGLMALMFFSSRHGWDDAQRQDLENRTEPGGGGDSRRVRDEETNYK